MPNVKVLKPDILKYLCRCFIVNLFDNGDDSLRNKVFDLWDPTIHKWRMHSFDDSHDYIHDKLYKALLNLNILSYGSIGSNSEGLSHMGNDLFESYLLKDTYTKSMHTHKFPFMTASHFWKQLYKRGLPKIYVSKKNLRWYIAQLIPFYDESINSSTDISEFMKENKPYINSICTPLPLNIYKSHKHHN